MSSAIGLGTQGSHKGTLEHDRTNNRREGNSEDTSGPDSDFLEEEDMPLGEGGDTGNQKSVEEQAAELVAEKLAAAGKLAEEKLAAAAGKLAIGKLAAGKSAAGKPAAEKLAAEKLAAEKLARGKPEVNLIPDGKEISKRLKDLIKKDREGLQKIYVGGEAELDKILKDPIERGEKMARKLIEEEKCSREIAKDLTVLTLYDVAILIGMF